MSPNWFANFCSEHADVFNSILGIASAIFMIACIWVRNERPPKGGKDE